MNGRINGPMLDVGTRRVLTKEVVAFPVPRRSDWSGYESATAVRAHVLQDGIDTRCAKGALVGANACLERVRRQRLVAILAGGSELEHSASLSVTANARRHRLSPKRSFRFEQSHKRAAVSARRWLASFVQH
jgi:hypothetical protein